MAPDNWNILIVYVSWYSFEVFENKREYLIFDALCSRRLTDSFQFSVACEPVLSFQRIVPLPNLNFWMICINI